MIFLLNSSLEQFACNQKNDNKEEVILQFYNVYKILSLEFFLLFKKALPTKKDFVEKRKSIEASEFSFD